MSIIVAIDIWKCSQNIWKEICMGIKAISTVFYIICYNVVWIIAQDNKRGRDSFPINTIQSFFQRCCHFFPIGLENSFP